MVVNTANADWKGTIMEGKGSFTIGGSNLSGVFTVKSRFQDGDQTNPEGLIAAAHAGCYSMALAYDLEQNGYTPQSVSTEARVSIEHEDDRFVIKKIVLDCVTTLADGEKIDDEKFQEFAEITKKTCPVSRALASVEDIQLNARIGTQLRSAAA